MYCQCKSKWKNSCFSDCGNRWSVGKSFFETFGVQIDTVYGETIGKLEKERLLIKEKGQIRLTERGVDISNYVMSEFLF